MSKYNIGLFGFGCVGQGLYHTLSGSGDVDAEIVKICVKNKDKSRQHLATDKFTFNPDAILDDNDINIIVELIDDADAAFSIVKKALQKGKAVVTANKRMVAENLDELIGLQEKYSTPLLYEGAVCGSIPIIRNLEDYYASEQILDIRGIFNGSSNYILTHLFQGGLSYDDALASAQKSGFAETDPSMDVGGFDAKFKLSIMIRHAYGLAVAPTNIFNWGIDHITDQDVHFAKERGLKIKLVARAVVQNNMVSISVAPHYIGSDDPLYHVENEYNCVVIHGKYAHDQILTGKGAGSFPTGLAVLADVVSLTKNYAYHYKVPGNLEINNEEEEVYLRFSDFKDIDFSLFTSISEKFTGQNHGYVIGKIELTDLTRLLTAARGPVNVIFTSGKQLETEIPKLTYSYA